VVFCNAFSEQVSRVNGTSEYLFAENEAWLGSNFIYFGQRLWEGLSIRIPEEILQANLRKYVFCIFHYAYALAQGQNIQNKRWIIHQLHWCEDIQGLQTMQADFPDLKMLGTMRDPVRGYYSLMSLYFKSGSHYTAYEDMVFDGQLNNAFRHMLMGWRNAERIMGKSVYAVQLERLHETPERVMREVAHELGISWSPSLLKSTLNGYPFSVRSGVHGQVGEGKTFDLARSQYQHWRENMHRLEAFALEGLLATEIETYKRAEISELQKRIGWIFVIVPTLLEIRAFQASLSDQDFTRTQQVLLTYFERCYYAFLFICGYDTFYSDPILRRKPE